MLARIDICQSQIYPSWPSYYMEDRVRYICMIQVHNNNNTLSLIKSQNDNRRCKFYNIGIYNMTIRRIHSKYLYIHPAVINIYNVIHWAKVALTI